MKTLMLCGLLVAAVTLAGCQQPDPATEVAKETTMTHKEKTDATVRRGEQAVQQDAKRAAQQGAKTSVETH